MSEPKVSLWHNFVAAGAVIFACVGSATAQTANKLPPPIKALQSEGVVVTGEFDAPGGLRGFAARIGHRPLAIYVTADGKQAVVGTLIDANGKDLSEEPIRRLVMRPMTEKIWGQLQRSTWIQDGRDSAANVVYVFTDPECPYCSKFWKDARPWVESGQAQLRHVMVGFLKPSSEAKAAAILSAEDPGAALTAYETRHDSLETAPTLAADMRRKLDANRQLMRQLGASATPAIFYQDGEGMIRSLQGAPSARGLREILGGGKNE